MNRINFKPENNAAYCFEYAAVGESKICFPRIAQVFSILLVLLRGSVTPLYSQDSAVVAPSSTPTLRTQIFSVDEFGFERAYYRDQTFTILSYLPVDWQALAREHFHLMNLDKPEPEEIRKRWHAVFGTAQFEYEAPVPSELMKGYYYLIATHGVFALRLEKALGSISYKFDQHAKNISTPSFYGELSAHVEHEQKPDDAAFAISSTRRLSFEIQHVSLGTQAPLPRVVGHRNGQDMIYTFSDDEHEAISFLRMPFEYPDITAAYILNIQPNRGKYLFVRWESDKDCQEACCEFIYALYRIGQTLEEVVRNHYNCDI